MAIMIKIVSTFLLLLSFLHASHVSWMGIYDNALALAKKEHKPMLVLLVKDDCPTCNACIAKTFMNQPYIQKIKRDFIPIIVTAEGKTSYPIELYYATTFPTLFMVDSATEHFIKPPLFGKDINPQNLKRLLDE